MTLFFLTSGLTVFTLVKCWQRVPWDLNTAFTSRVRQVRSICSDVFLRYGTGQKVHISGELCVWKGVRNTIFTEISTPIQPLLKCGVYQIYNDWKVHFSISSLTFLHRIDQPSQLEIYSISKDRSAFQ